MIAAGKGRFFLIGGGAAARTMGEPFMKKFVEEAGGSKAALTILTAGSDYPESANTCYWDIFSSLGVSSLFSPKILSREEAQEEGVASRLAESTAVFIAGGAQAKLEERLLGTAVERAIREVLASGGIVGGTSAGASIFGNPLILEGGSADRHLRDKMAEIGKGFGLLGTQTAVDTHCSSRGRIPRMISLLIQNPKIRAIGIDEDTVLSVHADGTAEILGHNAIYILDGHDCEPAHGQTEDMPHLCASGITLHCLMKGDRYDLFEPKSFSPEPDHEFVGNTTSKGQVTIPAQVRRMLGIKPNDKILFLIQRQNVLLRKPL